MNLTAIYGATPNMTYNSDILSRITLDTLLELGVYVDEVKLIDKNIPYLNSTAPNMNVANIMSMISNSDGVIFICTTNFFSPSSVMQNFLDYFSLPIYKNILKNKNCFLLTVSNITGEKSSLEYLSKIVLELGGFDCIKLGINFELAKLITTNQDYKTTFERYVEDFYRYVNQNRKFFVPSDVPTIINSMITNTRIDSKELHQESQQNIPNPNLNQNMTLNNMHTEKEYQQPKKQHKHVANYNPGNNGGKISGNAAIDRYSNSMNNNMEYNSINTSMHNVKQNQSTQTNSIKNKNFNKSYNKQAYNFDASNEDELFLQSILNSDDEFNNVRSEISQSARDMANQNNYNPNSNYDFDNRNQPDFSSGSGTGANSNSNYNYENQNIHQDFEQVQEEPKQHNDIKEMAKYFQGKYSPTSNNDDNYYSQNTQPIPVINEPLYEQPKENIVPSDKTTKQMTQNLVHYYQPQLGNGLVSEIQLNITGLENFDGFLRINNNQCDYFAGWSNTPDVTIVSSDTTWKKVLSGQISSQRAFMTGQLKVRGNFVLLSKFDQLFGL